MRLLPVLALPAVLYGCGQEIVVLDCDGHVEPGNDTGLRDQGVADGGLDGSTQDLGFADGGQDDGAISDTGPLGCTGSPYCITMLTATPAEGIVRTPVSLAPTVDNPQAIALTYRVELAGATRRAEFPALVMSNVTTTLNVNPTTGEVSFVVNDVPTFFTTTTFRIRLYAKGPGSMPEISFTGDAVIKGNVVVSGTDDVFAMASDGRPARSINFSDGRLITTDSFVRNPRDLLVARDGTLVVMDIGASPRRLRRFALDAENSLLGDFAFQDASSVAYLDSTEIGRGLVQLPDGKIAALDYSFSRNPSSKIVVWNEDGSYLKTIVPLNDPYWNGLSFTDASQLVTLEHTADGSLVTIDVTSGLVSPTPIATGLANGWTVGRSRDGFYYVGLTSAVLRVSPAGGRQMVNGIQSGTSDYYQYFAPFGATQMLISRDYGSNSLNVGAVTGTTFDGWIRPMGIPAPYLTPYGVAYLD